MVRTESTAIGEDQTAINAKLYLLLQTTNIEISYELFCVLLSLLREGVTPEAIYVCLQHISSHSSILKRLRHNLSKASKSNAKQLKLNNAEMNAAN